MARYIFIARKLERGEKKPILFFANLLEEIIRYMVTERAAPWGEIFILTIENRIHEWRRT